MGGRVRHRCLRVPQPRFVLTETAFQLRSFYMAWILAYIGLPSIGGMVGFLKLLTSLSKEVAAMVGGKN